MKVDVIEATDQMFVATLGLCGEAVEVPAVQEGWRARGLQGASSPPVQDAGIGNEASLLS